VLATVPDMAEVVLSEADATLLAEIVAALEGYFRADEGDPTGRAHALRHLARRAAAQVARTGGAADAPAVADRLHEVWMRLRSAQG
jgi:hypothetical protein